jgi:hypothetical protein
MLLALSLSGIAVGAIAAAWPYLHVRTGAGPLAASERAQWVSRLFALAEKSDSQKDEAVSSAARALIAALVARQQKG